MIMMMMIIIIMVEMVMLVMVVVVCRYGVVVDGERGNRPNIMAQQDLLTHTVRLFSCL